MEEGGPGSERADGEAGENSQLPEQEDEAAGAMADREGQDQLQAAADPRPAGWQPEEIGQGDQKVSSLS